MNDTLPELPDTPAGRQLGWWIGMVNRQGEGASPADWDRYAPELRAQLRLPSDAEAQMEPWRANAAWIGRVTEVAVEQDQAFEIKVAARTDKDRRWLFTATVEPAPPHRLTGFAIERRYDFELGFREATPEDALILADIERRCPIVMGDVSVHFDRGEDYMDATRLMDDCSIGLASVDGIPAAVSCGAGHVVRIGGALKRIVTVSHLRVLPEHQRKGLWGAANKVLAKYRDRTDGSNAFISVDNLGMQHGFANTPNKWPQVIDRAVLDCAALAGPPAGRPATAADVDDIVARLNAFHGPEEMFVPYTAESFAARVARAPDLYSWDRVWLTDGALVGAWAHGNALRTVTVTAGVETISKSGVVLDYAFAPGAEGEFEALLRAWCGRLAAEGFDSLVIYTSKASPGADLIGRLAREVGGYFMWTPGIDVPAGAETRGLYTDAAYF
ncbi:MAG TPA: hypothetical protein VG939_07680 [Caulobacteraceae bacterium]|nr:hypothetical protein [Caulobacteraceae bacterium]